MDLYTMMTLWQGVTWRIWADAIRWQPERAGQKRELIKMLNPL